MSSEEQIHNAYKPCRQCLSMDPIFQADIIEGKREEYLISLAGILKKPDYNARVQDCYACIESREKESQRFKEASATSVERFETENPRKVA